MIYEYYIYIYTHAYCVQILSVYYNTGVYMYTYLYMMRLYHGLIVFNVAGR